MKNIGAEQFGDLDARAGHLAKVRLVSSILACCYRFNRLSATAAGLIGPGRLALEEGARRCGHILLAHQTLADEDGGDAMGLQAHEILMGGNAALRDDDSLGGDFRSEPFAHLE